MTKLFSVLITGLVLAGCATTTKPWMSDAEYESYSTAYFTVTKCGESGKIPSSIAAQGLSRLKQNINTYSYFPERLSAYFELKNSEGTLPSKGDCNNVAISIQEHTQGNTTYNQGIQGNQKYQVELPKRTICNQVGTQTMCSTY